MGVAMVGPLRACGNAGGDADRKLGLGGPTSTSPRLARLATTNGGACGSTAFHVGDQRSPEHSSCSYCLVVYQFIKLGCDLCCLDRIDRWIVRMQTLSFRTVWSLHCTEMCTQYTTLQSQLHRVCE